MKPLHLSPAICGKEAMMREAADKAGPATTYAHEIRNPEFKAQRLARHSQEADPACSADGLVIYGEHGPEIPVQSRDWRACEVVGKTVTFEGLPGRYVLRDPAPAGPPAVDFDNALLAELARGSLIWLEAAGVGYVELEADPAAVYDQAYFDRYAEQAGEGIGPALMAHRVGLVKRHVGDLALAFLQSLDVGIGSGAFVEAMVAMGFPCAGYDVNPAGVAWLEARGGYRDLWSGELARVVTFWDCLEHMRRPDLALQRCADWAFVALPIFTGPEQARASKHFRPSEHAWYFTRDGFRRFAEAQGFRVVDVVATETALGREGVETFVLRRAA